MFGVRWGVRGNRKDLQPTGTGTAETIGRGVRRYGGGRVGRRAVAAPHRVRRTQKQGCLWQPCSLSMLDSLKPIQFGFFGSLGSFFPKKLPKSGCGVKPRIYNSRTVGARGGASHIFLIPVVGVWGSAPHIPIPHVGVWGGEHRRQLSPAGSGAPRIASPCAALPRRGMLLTFSFS